MLAGIDSRAEDLRQELRTEADSQDGKPGSQGLFDQAQFLADERQGLLVVGAHRSAHHNQGGDSGVLAQRDTAKVFPIHGPIVEFGLVRLEDLGETSEPFMRDMLKDDDL